MTHPRNRPPNHTHRLTAGLMALALATAALLSAPATTFAEEGDDAPDATLEVTVNIPSDLDSFHGAALVATLYEYDPRLADAPATPVAQVVVRHMGHQKGIRQSLQFDLAADFAGPKPQRRYYVSCRIYEDAGDEDGYVEGEQLHYCHNEHDRLPGTVYDDTNGQAPVFTAR